MAETINTAATRTSIRRVLESLPEVATTEAGLASTLMERAGRALLARIRRAFVVKSKGGTDEAGDRWEPLAPSTIAARRRKFAAKDSKRVPRKFDADPLTKKQAEWWRAYRAALRYYGGDRKQAAIKAWHKMRGTRAPSVQQQYAGRRVDILKDTGLLLDSLSPGSPTSQSVFRLAAGEVTIGTNREWAGTHHRGTRRIPQRRLWPEVSRWPASWWRDVTREVRAGLLQVAMHLLRAQRGT